MEMKSALLRYVPSTSRRFTGFAIAAAATLLVLAIGLGLVAHRGKPADAPAAVAVLDRLQEQQAEIDGLSRELAALRGNVDLLQAELARAGVQHIQEPTAEQPRVTDTPGLPAAPKPLVLAGTGTGASLQHVAAPLHASRRTVKAQTVVVDGVTYVKGREPRALSLPVQ